MKKVALFEMGDEIKYASKECLIISPLFPRVIWISLFMPNARSVQCIVYSLCLESKVWISLLSSFQLHRWPEDPSWSLLIVSLYLGPAHIRISHSGCLVWTKLWKPVSVPEGDRMQMSTCPRLEDAQSCQQKRRVSTKQWWLLQWRSEL